MGIISTLMLFLGVVAAVYMKCKRNKSKHMYTEIPSSPVTPPPAFPFMTPSPSPTRCPTPTRLPRVIMEDECEYEPVSKRTPSATKKKIRYQVEEETEL